MIFQLTVELTIASYEFPRSSGSDAEWLEILVSVHAIDQD